jgi:hypothetical protein
MSKQHSLGIDLGTSNSVVTFAPAGTGELRVMPVTQILSASSVGERDLLASALYVAHPSEFPSDSLRLPWGESAEGVVGHFAREHGALIPDRLITSAKSWLCQHHADRKAPILPWNSDLTEGKVSPFEASRLYLQHLRANVVHHLGPTAPLDDCEVVITVPASFDEVARALTHEAAEAAGFPLPTLLEEPLAAFYAWLADTGENWRHQIRPGDIVLVCDLGGGTADFSLIAVAETEGNLELNRISVGDHILLGGDNMDLALAYTVRAALEAGGTLIDDWQFLALTHGCRVGKEILLAEPERTFFPISIPSRGSSLFARTISAQLTREQVEGVVLDGFLPLTALTEQPSARRSVGLQEFGLAYASDPVISKHLARFLTRSLANVRSNQDLATAVGPSALAGEFLQPTSILFNGGVFNAPALRERVLSLLRSWSPGVEVRELTGGHLDLSVSKGAAHYGRMMLTGEGLRIRAGTARSYYVGLESSMPAVPGFRPPVKAVCVAPQGMEEGTKRALETREFGLVTGEPVTFRFFSSSIRAGDEVGTIVADAERELEETAHLQMTLEAMDGMPDGDVVPVRLHSSVTELGTLELWMHHTDSKNRWKLEFNVRGDES